MAAAASEYPARKGADVFAQRLIGIINDGGLALLISIGHRTGLFDVMVDRQAATPQEIADAAGLNERHVRKWLEGVAKEGIVSRDPGSGGYRIPPEWAAQLSRAAVRNMAALAGFVPLLGALEDQIVERFQKNGHTPYDARPSFRQFISRASHESDRAVIGTLMDSILPLVPGIEEALQSGIDVLDVGCGRGRAVELLASTFPNSRFTGYDPSQERVDHANFTAFAMGLNNVRFQIGDVADLYEQACHDLALDFDAIRHERRPRQVLGNIARALRPAGVLLMQEGAALSHPEQTPGLPQDSPLVAVASLAETDTGENGPAPAGVQGVIGLLLESGFGSAAVHQLPHHLYNCVFVATKSPC